MDKRKFFTFILAAILMLSFMILVVPRVQAAPQHPIVLPFFTGWEDLDPAHGRKDSVDYSEDFSSPECGRVLNEVPPPDVYGYDFGSWQLKAAGQFDSSNSYCYFNLFDMTPDSEWGPPIKIRPYTFINIWYYHANLAHSMIDAQLYNQRTGQYDTLRNFVYEKRINGMIVRKYVVDQNEVRIHPGYRYNDSVDSWQFASFDLSIIYEDDPENWYITKIWIGFDNRIDPEPPTGQVRTYFDMLYISYGAGNRQVITEDETGYYYNAWTTGSITTRRYMVNPDTGTYDLELKVAISAFNDGYTKDEFGGPEDPIRPYKLRVSTTAAGAEFLDYPVPTGLNLTQPDPGTEEVAEFVLGSALILVSLKYAPVGWLMTGWELASAFCGLLKTPDPKATTYEWPDGVGWFGYDPYALPTLIQGEVVLKISGLSSGVTHPIPITFKVEYCYPYHDPIWGLYPVLFMWESFTLNITWSSTPDDVNLPPDPPSTPSGPASGYTYTTYPYSTNTTDPEGDDVRYEFWWGDGTTTTTGWYASGDNATAYHHWTSPGTYQVQVKAQDHPYPHLWSDWSPILAVTITALPQPPPVQENRYWVMGGITTSCGYLNGTLDWKWMWTWPFATRPPYLTPMLMVRNITFSDPVTGVVYLTVPAESYVGLEHIWYDETTNLWYRLNVTMIEDGFGWMFLNATGDVDYYTFSNNSGVYWLSPSPFDGQLAALPGGFPSVGPDGIAGTNDDGFGDDTLDPPGSSILYLPTTLHVDYWGGVGVGWVLLFSSPWPQVLTTAVAYNIVIEPASKIDGVNSTEVGEPWEFLAGLDHPEYDPVPWNHNYSNAYVTYTCVWSVLLTDTPPGWLDMLYKVVERIVREDCVIADIDGDEIVSIMDITKIGLAYGSQDEGWGRPYADPNWDARADLKDERGLIDISDLVRCSIDYGASLTPDGIIRP